MGRSGWVGGWVGGLGGGGKGGWVDRWAYRCGCGLAEEDAAQERGEGAGLGEDVLAGVLVAVVGVHGGGRGRVPTGSGKEEGLCGGQGKEKKAASRKIRGARQWRSLWRWSRRHGGLPVGVVGGWA